MVREEGLTSDAARAAILSAIADALGPERHLALPESAPIFSPEDVADVAARFRDELAAVAGEACFVPSRENLPAVIAALLAERGQQTVAVQDSEAAQRAASQLPAECRLIASQAAKEQIEAADCSIIEAAALLADTGSCIVRVRSYGDRLLPYLPPHCIAVADGANVFAHMQDAQAALFDAAHSGERGEIVIVTGPSSTADIEKTVVLGAHGPRSLTVFIIGREPPREFDARE